MKRIGFLLSSIVCKFIIFLYPMLASCSHHAKDLNVFKDDFLKKTRSKFDLGHKDKLNKLDIIDSRINYEKISENKNFFCSKSNCPNDLRYGTYFFEGKNGSERYCQRCGSVESQTQNLYRISSYKVFKIKGLLNLFNTSHQRSKRQAGFIKGNGQFKERGYNYFHESSKKSEKGFESKIDISKSTHESDSLLDVNSNVYLFLDESQMKLLLSYMGEIYHDLLKQHLECFVLSPMVKAMAISMLFDSVLEPVFDYNDDFLELMEKKLNNIQLLDLIWIVLDFERHDQIVIVLFILIANNFNYHDADIDLLLREEKSVFREHIECVISKITDEHINIKNFKSIITDHESFEVHEQNNNFYESLCLSQVDSLSYSQTRLHDLGENERKYEKSRMKESYFRNLFPNLDPLLPKILTNQDYSNDICMGFLENYRKVLKQFKDSQNIQVLYSFVEKMAKKSNAKSLVLSRLNCMNGQTNSDFHISSKPYPRAVVGGVEHLERNFRKESNDLFIKENAGLGSSDLSITPINRLLECCIEIKKYSSELKTSDRQCEKTPTRVSNSGSKNRIQVLSANKKESKIFNAHSTDVRKHINHASVILCTDKKRDSSIEQNKSMIERGMCRTEGKSKEHYHKKIGLTLTRSMKNLKSNG